MKPLPKWVGVVSALAVVFGALNTAQVLAVVAPNIAALITIGASVLTALSHSLTGTGGKP